MKHATQLLVALVVLTAAIPAGVAAIDGGADGPILYDTDGNETETNETTEGENPDFEESEDPELADDGSPGDAQSLRVTPVQFDEDWLDVETDESDEAFATTGPFAAFAISAPAENVRIAQSSADAQLLDGEQTVKVEYDDDAASDGGSLYELELFFADGSQKTLELTASQTAVSVDGAEYAEYSDVIAAMEDEATDRGFEETPEGLMEYHEFSVERMEIIESFLVEQAQQVFGMVMMFVQVPLAWVLAFAALGLGAYHRERTHGWALDRMENDPGETARKNEDLKSRFRDHVEAANEEYIGELKEVNDQQAQYFRDAFDTWSVRQLAELAKRGPHQSDDDLAADGGDTSPAISELDPETIHDSWLAEAFSTNRLADPQEALTCMRAALVRMDSTYGLGHQYDETREELESLLEDIRETEARY